MQFFSVSGDANFSMKHTGLTIGGFTQPFVARNLIDVQANVEKGLCQRFLWLVPEPNLVTYEQMCKADTEFTTGIGEYSYLASHHHQLFCYMFISVQSVLCPAFGCLITQKKYGYSNDQVMCSNHCLTRYKPSCTKSHAWMTSCRVGYYMSHDNMFAINKACYATGMISKSKGQVLRLSAVFHALFNVDTPLDIPDVISDDALKAASAFVNLCNQHTAYIAGRGSIPEAIAAIEEAQKGKNRVIHMYVYVNPSFSIAGVHGDSI